MKVLLTQLPNPEFMVIKRFGNTPLAAGYLKAMADQADLLDRVTIEIMDHDLMNLGTDQQIIRQTVAKAPDILGFTLYLWNIERSLHIAGEVKKALPDLKVIIGGPEVTPDNDFLLSHDVIDLGCHKEGEQTFVDILRHYLGEIRDPNAIAGIFHKASGRPTFTKPREPLRDLSTIPSPFLKGYIDPAAGPVISIETSRGCHNKCKYCSWENRSLSAFPAERIGSELKLFREAGVKHVKFINSDILASLTQRKGALAKVVREVNANHDMALFGFLSPERISEEKADMLQQLGFTGVGVGLQSVNPKTLAQIGRKPDLDRFVAGCRRLISRKIEMEVEFIIGLPNDTPADYENIYAFLAENELITARDSVSPFLLLMLPGTTIRREVDAHGLVYNSRPPYQLIRSNYLSESDIKRAVGKRYAEISPDFFVRIGPDSYFSQLSESYAVIPNQVGTVAEPLGPDPSHPAYGTNKAILTLNAGRQTVDELAELGERLGKIAYQPFTVWLKSENLDRDLDLARALLVRLVDANPFVLLNLVLEVDRPFSEELLDHLTELPLKGNIFASTHIKPCLRTRILQPWSERCPAESSSDWDVYHSWTLSIEEEPHWDRKLQEAVAHDNEGGFIVDLGADPSPDFTARVLRFVVLDDVLKTRVVFRHFELNAALNCFDVNLRRQVAAALGLPKREMLFAHPPMETIISFNGDLSRPEKLFAPGPAESIAVKKHIEDLFRCISHH